MINKAEGSLSLCAYVIVEEERQYTDIYTRSGQMLADARKMRNQKSGVGRDWSREATSKMVVKEGVFAMVTSELRPK